MGLCINSSLYMLIIDQAYDYLLKISEIMFILKYYISNIAFTFTSFHILIDNNLIQFCVV